MSCEVQKGKREALAGALLVSVVFVGKFSRHLNAEESPDHPN